MEDPVIFVGSSISEDQAYEIKKVRHHGSIIYHSSSGSLSAALEFLRVRSILHFYNCQALLDCADQKLVSGTEGNF